MALADYWQPDLPPHLTDEYDLSSDSSNILRLISRLLHSIDITVTVILLIFQPTNVTKNNNNSSNNNNNWQQTTPVVTESE